jgi:hypothetical protein
MNNSDETVRFPTRLDPAAIYERMASVREAAQSSGLQEIATLLAGIEAMPRAEVGKVVIGALGMIGGKPEHQELAKQLQIIAMNLKNLK